MDTFFVLFIFVLNRHNNVIHGSFCSFYLTFNNSFNGAQSFFKSLIFEINFSVDKLIFSRSNWSFISQLVFCRSVEIIYLLLRIFWKFWWTFFSFLCVVLFCIRLIKFEQHDLPKLLLGFQTWMYYHSHLQKCYL